MSIQWLPIFLSAITSGLLSLLISHIYYRITVRSAEAHHLAQMQATATRHTEQTDQMASHHAEQLLVLRTTLLAVEHDSGSKVLPDIVKRYHAKAASRAALQCVQPRVTPAVPSVTVTSELR